MFGATPEDSVEGMFSFVPCLPADGALRGFPRPNLNDHPAINPNSWRAVGFNRRLKPTQFPMLWRRVTETVTKKGLSLATRLKLPPDDVFRTLPIE